jgi:hypothetical protein
VVCVCVYIYVYVYVYIYIYIYTVLYPEYKFSLIFLVPLKEAWATTIFCLTVKQELT